MLKYQNINNKHCELLKEIESREVWCENYDIHKNYYYYI